MIASQISIFWYCCRDYCFGGYDNATDNCSSGRDSSEKPEHQIEQNNKLRWKRVKAILLLLICLPPLLFLTNFACAFLRVALLLFSHALHILQVSQSQIRLRRGLASKAWTDHASLCVVNTSKRWVCANIEDFYRQWTTRHIYT